MRDVDSLSIFCACMSMTLSVRCVFFSVLSIGVNSSDICPPGALEDYLDEKSPRLRYLRLDGNEIKPPIPRELMMCFRLLRAIVI